MEERPLDLARTSLVIKTERAYSRDWPVGLPPSTTAVLARCFREVTSSTSVWPCLELPTWTSGFSLLIADLPLSFTPAQQKW